MTAIFSPLAPAAKQHHVRCPLHQDQGVDAEGAFQVRVDCRPSGAAAGDTIIEAPDPRAASIGGNPIGSINVHLKSDPIDAAAHKHNTARRGASPGDSNGCGFTQHSMKRWLASSGTCTHADQQLGSQEHGM